MNDIEKRTKLVIKRDEILTRFKSLHTMLFEAGADLANANADLARIDERIKINEISDIPKKEEE